MAKGRLPLTELELAYLIPKYLLMRGRTFAWLGPRPPSMQWFAASQDLIGWREFLEGRGYRRNSALFRCHIACRLRDER